uniref:Serine aminopeptidase S33 domain-containing protein n=1 Tax=Magnetococcus massalia (strain MO-1) TaxID=451514 RepID=A0A1S7LI81_MAGMO|nr:conserved protein of unknown function [Candidatus Magnetococcus massalia]
MHWSLWLGTFIVFYLGVIAWMYHNQDNMVFFPPRDIVESPKAWGLSFSELSLQSGPYSLHGWYIPGHSNRPVILFFHGNASNVGHMRDYAQLFNGLGYGALFIDYRGYGQSGGVPSEQGLYEDALACWRYLVEQQGMAPERIIPYGHSLGGGPALWLAQQKTVGAVIVEGAFTSVPDRGQELYPLLPVKLLARTRFNNKARVAQLAVPLLVIHSRDDEVIPVAHGEKLFRLATGEKRLVLTRGNHDGDVELNRAVLSSSLKILEEKMGR